MPPTGHCMSSGRLLLDADVVKCVKPEGPLTSELF